MPGWALLLSYFILGAVSALAQSITLREVLVTFFGTELSIGAFYGSWFIWIALGAWSSPKLQRLVTDRKKLYLAGHLLFAFVLLAQIVLLRYWRSMSGASALELITLEESVAGAFASAIGPGFLIGMLFPLAGSLLSRSGSEPGSTRAVTAAKDPVTRIYTWEAVGSLAGGLLFTHLLATRLQPHQALAAIGVLESAATVMLAAALGWVRGGWVAAAIGIAWAVGFTPVGRWANMETEKARWETVQRGYELVDTRYTPYSHVALGRVDGSSAPTADDRGGQAGPATMFGLFNDGVLAESFPDPHRSAEQAAHIAAQNPSAKKVLLLGGGPEGLAQQLARFPSIERIDCVLQDPWANQIVVEHLPERLRRPLEGGRIDILSLDGRKYVNDGAAQVGYDLVVSLVSRPTTAALNRYFTLGFFREVRSASPDAVFVLFFSRDEQTYLVEEEQKTLASIYQTLSRAFPHTGLLVGTFDYMVAGPKQKLATDPATLAHRYRSFDLTDWPYPPEAFPDRGLDEERSKKLRAKLAATRVRLNRDTRPVTYFHALRYLGRLSDSSLVSLLERASRSGRSLAWVLLAILFGLLMLKRLLDPEPEKARHTHTAFGIGALGFASITLQIVILLSFQSRLGSLYQELGRLTGVLMAGIAMGAVFGRYLTRRVGSVQASGGGPRALLFTALLLMALFAFSLPTILGALSGLSSGLATAGFLSVAGVSGFFTGLAFPLAVSTFDPGCEKVGRTGSVLDASDHAGACLGGLSAGVVLLPVLGTDSTCWLVGAGVAGGGVLSGLDLALFKLDRRQKPTPQARWSFPWKRAGWIMAGAVLLAYAIHWMSPKGGAEAEPGSTAEQKTAEQRKTEQSTTTEPRAGERSAARTPLCQRLLPRGIPEGYAVRQGKEPFAHIRLLKDGAVAEVVFSTFETAPDIRGYAGPVELIVRMKTDGTIRSVRLGKHSETPSYVSEVPGWLKKRFFGLEPSRAITGEDGVDALTGATISTQAIKRILAKSRRVAVEKLLPKVSDEGRAELAGEPEETTWLGRAASKPSFWIGLIVLLAGLAAYLKKSPGPRLIVLIASAGVFGFWLNVPITTVDVGLAGMGQITGTEIKVVIVVFAALLALSMGQVWCGYLCPFGALQELVWLVKNPRGLRSENDLGQSRRTPDGLDSAARYAKFVLLAVTLSLFALTENQSFFAFDPMVWVFRLEPTVWRIALLVIIGTTGLLLFRPWCRYLCPVGGLMALSNKIALADRRTSRRRVHKCDIGVHTPKDADCIRCNRCVKTKDLWK
jgi:spermidine synthase